MTADADAVVLRLTQKGAEVRKPAATCVCQPCVKKMMGVRPCAAARGAASTKVASTACEPQASASNITDAASESAPKPAAPRGRRPMCRCAETTPRAGVCRSREPGVARR